MTIQSSPIFLTCSSRHAHPEVLGPPSLPPGVDGLLLDPTCFSKSSMYSATTHCQHGVVNEYGNRSPLSKRTGSEFASLEYLAGILFRRFSIPNLILFLLFFSDKFFFESTWRQNYWRRPSAPHKTNLILTGEVRPLLDWDSPLCLGGSRLILHGLNGPEEGSTPE